MVIRQFTPLEKGEWITGRAQHYRQPVERGEGSLVSRREERKPVCRSVGGEPDGRAAILRSTGVVPYIARRSVGYLCPDRMTTGCERLRADWFVARGTNVYTNVTSYTHKERWPCIC